jgi:hypothetical protein
MMSPVVTEKQSTGPLDEGAPRHRAIWCFFGTFEAKARCRHLPGAEEDAAEHKANLSLSDNFAGVFKTHSIDCEDAFPFRNPTICFFLERQKSIISGRLLIIFESVE